GGIALDSGKSLAAAGVQIDARRANGNGIVEEHSTGRCSIQKWPKHGFARSRAVHQGPQSKRAHVFAPGRILHKRREYRSSGSRIPNRARREKSYRAKSCRHAGSAVEIGRSAADYLSAELAEASKLCGLGGLAAGGTGSGQSKPGAGGKILSAAAARSARSRFGVVVLGDAGSRRPALLRPRRAGFEHVFHSGARHGGRNISLACHTSRAHVRQPLFRFVALERMRYLRRLTASRCFLVGTAAVAAAAVTIVCWLPMPSA